MENVLITGGAGFIGSNLALKLLARDYKVTILDNLSPQIHGHDPQSTSSLYRAIKDKVVFIQGSIETRNDWERAIVGIDVIVHLAAETGTGQSMYEIKKYTDVNIGGTALMLDILANRKHSIKKIVVASSRAVYGEGRYMASDGKYVYPSSRKSEDMSKGDFDCKCIGYKEPLTVVSTDEDSKIHPTSIYGITKQAQEQLVMTVCPSIGISSVSFRYQNVYGPGQSLTNPYTGILSIFSTRIRNRNKINIFEDGRESRDFVYIDDAVDATILGIEKEEANGEIFNVGTGRAIDVLTIANTLVKKFGIDVPCIVNGNYRIGDIRHNYADITKLKTIFGFSPSKDFEEGIGQFIDWVNSQSIQNDNYEKSIKEMERKGLYK